MEKPILELKGITKSYEGKEKGLKQRFKKHQTLAVDHVDLCLYEGEILGLVGESGCGKSTLAHLIMGLMKEDSGHIYFAGENMANLKAKQYRAMRKNIQIIFQDAYGSLNPVKKIGWILKESLDINTNMTRDEKNRRIDEILSMVGLSQEFKGRYPKELSGGQRQRAAIAMALLLNPKVIIADEAVSALDVSIQAQILNLIMDLRKQLGLSYLFISHDLNVVYHLCDRIAVMKNGRIVESGISEAVFHHPENDYTKELLDAIPTL